MTFSSYIRKPFEVEAVEVTTQNIEELAPLIGTLKENEDGSPYIEVDDTKVPNVTKVWPGYWVTKVGRNNVRCYTHKIFFTQFVENTEDIDAWVRFINGKPAKRVPVPTES
jgi:hypothetical protein